MTDIIKKSGHATATVLVDKVIDTLWTKQFSVWDVEVVSFDPVAAQASGGCLVIQVWRSHQPPASPLGCVRSLPSLRPPKNVFWARQGLRRFSLPVQRHIPAFKSAAALAH